MKARYFFFNLLQTEIINVIAFYFTEDPVNILKHTKPPVNSVLKMFVDLFSIPETTTLFYTNDNKVLIDILVRQLADLSAGDPLRKWYGIKVTYESRN